MEVAQEVVIDPREFRNVLGRFATGVTVITTEFEAQVYGDGQRFYVGFAESTADLDLSR